MRFIIALIAVLLPLAAHAQAQDESFTALFAERNSRTLAVLEAEFPQDYRLLQVKLGAIERSDQSDMLKLSAGFALVNDVRKQYAPRLRFAPPAALERLLRAAAAFHERVLEVDGDATCGAFAQNGTGVFYQLGTSDKYVAEIDRQSAEYFTAVAAAIEHPETYGEAQKDDLALVLRGMLAAGSSQEQVALILTGPPSAPGYCAAIAAMFRIAAVLNQPAALRSRADLAVNLAGY
jgi:hypothetical protein